MKMYQKIALVSDFDGTISGDDFFYYITEKYLTPADMAPWESYLQGNKTHFGALQEIFAKLRVPEKNLQAFIRQIHLDPAFADVADFCHEQSLPLYICSAGCSYYINLLIGEIISKYNIKLIANHATYSPENGLIMTPPPTESLYYDANTGISKRKVVEVLQQLGYFVIYCGDGLPDFEAAQIADKVFARKVLLQKCQNAGIVAEELFDFSQVLHFLKEHIL